MDAESLINEVFMLNNLWDQRDKQHHNRDMLDKLWDEVAKEMKSSREIVRGRWKSLRDGFRRELKKTPKPRSGSEAVCYKSSWPYFQQMLFLTDQLMPRDSSGNLPSTSKETVLSESTVMNIQDSQDPEPEAQLTHTQDTCNINGAPLTPSSGSSSAPAPKKQRGVKRKQVDDIGKALVENEQKKLEALKEEKNKELDADMNPIFASTYERLAPKQKIIATDENSRSGI